MEVLLFYAVVVGLMCYTTKEFVELHKSKADLETSLEQSRTALENRIKEDLYEYEQMEENYLRVSVAYNGALDKQVVTPETYKNIYEVLMFGYEMPETVQFFYSSNLKKNNWVKTLEKYREVEGTVFCFNKKSKS